MQVDAAEVGDGESVWGRGERAFGVVGQQVFDCGIACSAPRIRGVTRICWLDEAAYIPDAVYEASRPMLAASKGDLVVMSSANEPATRTGQQRILTSGLPSKEMAKTAEKLIAPPLCRWLLARSRMLV